MKRVMVYSFFLSLMLSVFTLSAFAWDHSLELGYGRSHDPNDVKNINSGFMLSGDLYPMLHNQWTFWSINGALGQWFSSSRHNGKLSTIAISMALRFYPLTVENYLAPYLLGSVGPAIMSSRKFGNNSQGSNFSIQSNIGFGFEFNERFDINLRLAHYSNANLTNPNEGFNVLYLLSIGFLF